MVKRVFVWSGWLRALHGAMVLALLVLAVSGWLLQQGVSQDQALSWHQLANSLLAVSLFIRVLLLLFGKGAEHIKSFFNHGLPWQQFIGLLGFYLTLGKRPLPSWFARSVLWSLLYLLMYLLMLLAIAAGLLSTDRDMFMGLVLLDTHRQLATLLLWLVFLHIVSAIVHDIKAQNSNISAMLNGHRIFVIEKQKQDEQVVHFPAWNSKK